MQRALPLDYEIRKVVIEMFDLKKPIKITYDPKSNKKCSVCSEDFLTHTYRNQSKKVILTICEDCVRPLLERLEADSCNVDWDKEYPCGHLLCYQRNKDFVESRGREMDKETRAEAQKRHSCFVHLTEEQRAGGAFCEHGLCSNLEAFLKS